MRLDSFELAVLNLNQQFSMNCSQLQAERNEMVHSRLPTSVEFICFILSNSSPVLNCIIYIFAVKSIRNTIVKGYSQRMQSMKRRVSESALIAKPNQKYQLRKTLTNIDIDCSDTEPGVREFFTGDQVRITLCKDDRLGDHTRAKYDEESQKEENGHIRQPVCPESDHNSI